MTKLHSETNLAKIRSGDTSILKKPDQLPPLPKDPLMIQLEKNFHFDVEQGRLASWWNLGRIENVEEIVSAHARIANSIIALLEARSKAEGHAALASGKLLLQHVLIQNQTEVARQATLHGISPQDYSLYTLHRLEKQLEIEAKEMQANADIRTEHFSLVETFKAELTKATVYYERERQLIDQITELTTALHNVDFESLVPIAKQTKKKHLQRSIDNKESELASLKEALPTAYRTRLGRVIEGSSELEGPEE